MEKEVSEVDRKLLLRRTYLDKIHYYITRNPITQDELYVLVRKFFGEYLKIDYEFTYEELSSELTKVFITPKVKEHIDDFLIRLSECEYLEEITLGTTQINAFLEEFEGIIQNIIYDDKPQKVEEESLLKRVLKKHKEEVYDLSKVSSMIEEMNYHITSGNLETAKTSYIVLLKAFDSLSKEDKKKVHEELSEIYIRLQTLQKNPKTSQQAPAVIPAGNVTDAVKKVFNSVDETIYYINASDLESAKRIYSDTLSLYENLSKEEKGLAHLRVNDCFSQLQALMIKPSLSKEDANKAKAQTSADAQTSFTGDADQKSKPEEVNKALNMDLDKVKSGESAPVDQNSKEGSSMFNLQLSQSGSDKETSGNMLFGVQTSSADVQSDALQTDALKTADAKGEPFDFTKDIQPSVFEPVPKSPAVEQFDVFGRSLGTIQGNAPGRSEDLSDNKRSDAPSEDLENTRIEASVLSKKQARKNISAKKDNAKKEATKARVDQDASNMVLRIDNILSKQDSGSHYDASGADDARISRGVTAKRSEERRHDTDVINDAHPINAGQSEEPYAVKKIYEMIKKINDDMILDKLDNAKSTYKEALMLYKAMTSENKSRCYKRFFDMFNRLDAALHKRSLGDILDRHIDGSKQRPVGAIAGTRTSPVRAENAASGNDGQFDAVSRQSTLPILVSNDEATTRVYELIEEAYFNMDNGNADIAMLKYFSALELYHTLPVYDKKKLYPGLYELFTKLSASKKK